MSAHVRQAHASGDHIEVMPLEFTQRIPRRSAERHLPFRRDLTKQRLQGVKKAWILIYEQDALCSPITTILYRLIQLKKVRLHCVLFPPFSSLTTGTGEFLSSR